MNHAVHSRTDQRPSLNGGEVQLRHSTVTASRGDGLIEANLAKKQQKSGIFTEPLDVFHNLVLHCQHARSRGFNSVRMEGANFDVAIQDGAHHFEAGMGSLDPKIE